MGKVIKIITLNTFQMVMVRICDPPYCTLKVMFLSCRRRYIAGCYSYQFTSWGSWILRNGPDKNDSNNGNEHFGMQKRC